MAHLAKAMETDTEASPFEELSDEEHKKLFGGKQVRFKERREAEVAPSEAAKRIDEIRQQSRPLEREELEKARNKAVRMMIGNFHIMKPQEIQAAIQILDSEMAQLTATETEKTKDEEATRQQMIEQLKRTT